MNTKQVLFLYGNEQETKHEMAEHIKDHSENLWKKSICFQSSLLLWFGLDHKKVGGVPLITVITQPWNLTLSW